MRAFSPHSAPLTNQIATCKIFQIKGSNNKKSSQFVELFHKNITITLKTIKQDNNVIQ